MTTYIVLQGPRVGASASIVATASTPEAALRAARQWQHAETERRRRLKLGKAPPCWVERDDGCILGGTYPWTGNAEHARRAEHLNWARGFAGYPPKSMHLFEWQSDNQHAARNLAGLTYEFGARQIRGVDLGWASSPTESET